MKYFLLNKTMDNESLGLFLAFANENKNDEWTIIIDSGGGRLDVMLTMVHIINKRKDKCTLISNNCYSAAFELFYLAKCKKYITSETMGMVHLPMNTLTLNVKNNLSYKSDIAVVKRWKETSEKRALSFVKKFLTKEELKKCNNGDDIFLTFKRMKEIFPDAEVI